MQLITSWGLSLLCLLFTLAVKAGDETPRLNPRTPPSKAPDGMTWVPGGEFYMGIESTARILHDSSPSHLVYVDGFWMGTHEVTNEEFERFVRDTRHKTTAELPPPKVEGPGPENKRLLTDPWSFVFVQPKNPVKELFPPVWWQPVFGASWRHPEGPGSTIKGLEKHPVVHVSWDDAKTYCEWLTKNTGKKHRLPTEAEWEFAARGGLDRKKFVWGDEKDPKGKPACNYWQGDFPNENTKKDGFFGIAPVGSFAPNGYGLHDMAGNVWEWCSDWYRADYYHDSPKRNPRGPGRSKDEVEPDVPMRVMRGGSFLCADNYCQRFLPAARHKGEQGAAWNHTGFRVVREP